MKPAYKVTKIIGKPFEKEFDFDTREWTLPNGRYVFRTSSGKFEVQPPNDNWWHSETTLAASLEWFEAQYRGPMEG
jgi:hypothetical protein